MNEHDPAFVVNHPHVTHAHEKAAVNPEHLRSHVASSNSTVTPDVNSYVSPTLTRGHGADLREEPSAKRLSPHGPPARSTGLTPERQVDRFPIFEVCENCSTRDQTVITCRIDPQTLMKLCKPCAKMVRTVHSGRNSPSSSSSDGVSDRPGWPWVWAQHFSSYIGFCGICSQAGSIWSRNGKRHKQHPSQWT